MLERSSWHHCFLGVASVQEALMDVLGGSYQTSLWFQIIWVLCHTEDSNSQVLRWGLSFQIMIMLGKEYTVIAGYDRGFFDISLSSSAFSNTQSIRIFIGLFTFFFYFKFMAQKLFLALHSIPLKPTSQLLEG